MYSFSMKVFKHLTSGSLLISLGLSLNNEEEEIKLRIPSTYIFVKKITNNKFSFKRYYNLIWLQYKILIFKDQLL